MKRSIAVVSALSILGFPCLSAPVVGATPQNGAIWFLDPEPALTGGLGFSCGKYGRFEVRHLDDDPALIKCSAIAKATACGSELLPVYPSPDFPKPSPKRRQFATNGAAWRPCEGGLCFADRGSLRPGQPWTAVVDWNDLHGWSVGWTIHHLANPPGGTAEIPVVLFDLYDDLALEPFSRLGATDVHVLKQLCRIAEIADQGDNPPQVINMSFGRLLRPDDDAVSASTCDESTLSCQVAKVLHHLACGDSIGCPSRPRTIPVAAAGNEHFYPMFPAAHENVIAAGSLQLGKFAADGKTSPSWETPSYAPKPAALLPGYGLCLEQEENGQEWPTPPGTSYAAAVFSGWLAETLGRAPVEKPFSRDAWFPRLESAATGQAVYTLAHGETNYGSNPRIERLFQRVLNPALEACKSVATGSAPPRTASLGEQESLELLSQMPGFVKVLDELTRNASSPAPLDIPCVSCFGPESASPPAAHAKAAGGLSIDMAASARPDLFVGYPDLAALEGIEQEAVYLRTGEKLFQVKLGRADTTDAIPERILFDTRVWIDPGEQPSLVYVYKGFDLRFWTSVPILLRPQ